MRIDHVVPHFYPEVGGVESHVLRLSEYLVSRGHEVVVHTSRRAYSGGLLPDEGSIGRIVVRRYTPLFRLGYYATLFTPVVAGADVVHLHGYMFLTNDWAARRVHGRIPLAFSLHHGVAQPAPSRASRLKRVLYDALLGSKTLTIADAIIAASEPDREWLTARRFPVPRVDVIPTGLDDDAYLRGDPGRARARFGLGRYLLFLGRLHQEKSVDDLLRAFASLGTTDVSVVLAGPDAGARDTLLELAKRLGITDSVKAVGTVDEPTKRDLLAGAEALVLPSMYEAQGIVLLEAWAQSTPVIASNVGGVPFLVSDRNDGFLFPFRDAKALAARLGEILSDSTGRLKMGAEGRRKAQGYSFTSLGPRFVDLYQEIART